MLFRSAFIKFKVALEIAFEHGGFDAVIAVCNDLTAGAAKTDRPVGIWAETEWKGLDFLNSKFPDSTKKLGAYYERVAGAMGGEVETDDATN